MSVNQGSTVAGWRAHAVVALLVATGLAVVSVAVGQLANGPSESFAPTARAARAIVVVGCLVATRRRARSTR